jgi:hypothetical protein
MRKTVLTVSLYIIMMVAVPFTWAYSLGEIQETQFRIRWSVNLFNGVLKVTKWNISGTFDTGLYFKGPLTFESEGSTTAESSFNDVAADSWYKILDEDGTVLYKGGVAEFNFDIQYNSSDNTFDTGSDNFVLLESPYFDGFKFMAVNMDNFEFVFPQYEYTFTASGYIACETSDLIPPKIAITSPNPRYHSSGDDFDPLNHVELSAVNSGVNHDLDIDTQIIPDIGLGLNSSLGVYTVTYTYTDAAGISADAVLDVVVVVNPTVRSTTPIYNAVDVRINEVIKVFFSEPMDADTIDSNSLYINNGNVSAGVAYNSSDNSASIDPDSDLAYDTTYNVTITTAVEREYKSAGPDDLYEDYKFSFTTQSDDRVTNYIDSGDDGSSSSSSRGGCFIGTLR